MLTASRLIFCWTLLTTKHLVETQQLLQARILNHYSARKADYTPVCDLTHYAVLGVGLFVSDDAKCECLVGTP